MYTTLNKIREQKPCRDGWEKLLKYLGKTGPDDEPLSLLTILDSNGFDHALWCFRAVEGCEKEKLLLGIGFAREVQHLMPAESEKALDVFERYANGLATEEEFKIARKAADAAWSAAAARSAHAAYAASAATDAADVAYGTARAAWFAAAAWSAARSAAVGAWSAASAATRSTIKAKQETQLRQLLERTKNEHTH